MVLIEEGIKFDDLQKRVQEKFETSKLKVTFVSLNLWTFNSKPLLLWFASPFSKVEIQG